MSTRKPYAVVIASKLYSVVNRRVVGSEADCVRVVAEIESMLATIERHIELYDIDTVVQTLKAVVERATALGAREVVPKTVVNKITSLASKTIETLTQIKECI